MTLATAVAATQLFSVSAAMTRPAAKRGTVKRTEDWR